MGAGGSTAKQITSANETLSDHDESINCMALSEDGSMLVTGSEDNEARMWSTVTPDTECIGVLKGHSSYINAVVVCETFVITGSADSTIRKWDMTTCECCFVYTGHTARIQKLIVTGDFIFSSSYDKTARAWHFDTQDIGENMEDEACIRTFQGHTKGVYPIIFIPAEDFDPNDGAVINPGDMLITGSADHTARSWSFDTGGCLKVFKGHGGAITCMSTDTAGKVLYTAGADAAIKSWNISTGQLLRNMDGHTGALICMVVVNRLMYTGSADGTARCWVTEFGDSTRHYKGHKHTVICLKFHKGILFTGCGDGVVRAYDAKSGSLRRTYHSHEGAVNCLIVVGKKIFTGSSDSTLRVWIADDVLSEDLTVDEAPPLPTPATDTLSSLARELESPDGAEDEELENADEELGIQDDDNFEYDPAKDEPEDDEKEEEDPGEENTDDMIDQELAASA